MILLSHKENPPKLGERSMADNIKIGEVYYANTPSNGSVQGGYRPHIVWQNNVGNKYSPNVVLIPLTSVMKKTSLPTHVMLSADETGLPKDSIALCENPVSFPKDKLEKYVTTISDENLKKIAIANTLASSAISFLNMNELISL